MTHTVVNGMASSDSDAKNGVSNPPEAPEPTSYAAIGRKIGITGTAVAGRVKRNYCTCTHRHLVALGYKEEEIGHAGSCVFNYWSKS